MGVLSSGLRRQLESAVLAARRAAEGAASAAVEGLGVFSDRRPEHLDADRAVLRNGLRAKWRQLGGYQELLIAECAYEQWHRLLFARFLAENGLLLHPQYKAPVSLTDCEELAPELGEADGWSVAARFAAEILPGIFRLDDPCMRLRLAPEGRHALEQILTDLPSEVFSADDALGWVYQFWQTDKKDEVNASERKIGGADLGPVTQLFTENYMVRFLLENSLGAWWAARHPDSSLVKTFEYLRFGDDGSPAAGSFDGWPNRVAEVTVMDPCCGSGHFLVEAFAMLWQMRAEEEGIDPVEAQDAVLRDNLFGLELDPRCVQIAMFALALQAWKAGGGWRQLPVPNVACSGIPVKAPVAEWTKLAGGDERLENALVRLHILFRDADTLGSLIDPKQAAELTDPSGRQHSFDDVEWDDLAPLLEKAVETEMADPATAVLGADAAGVARAADYLSRRYTLVTTNPPFLKRGNQSLNLRAHADLLHSPGSADLATTMLDRWRPSALTGSFVEPSSWTYQAAYKSMRRTLLEQRWPSLLVSLGAGAFESISGEIVNVCLVIGGGVTENGLKHADLSGLDGPVRKAKDLISHPFRTTDIAEILKSEECRIVFDREWNYSDKLLSASADGYIGFQSGDNPRYRRQFWEVSNWELWRPLQSTFDHADKNGAVMAGCDEVIAWDDNHNLYADEPGARMQGTAAWGKRGVAVSLMGDLRTVLYSGIIHDNSTGVVIPHNEQVLPAVWCFMSSDDYPGLVRRIDRSLKVNATSLVKVPFDVDYWREVAAERFPDGLPESWSDDPTQWLFGGRPEDSTAPLQAAVGRLVGYRWPKQAGSDELAEFADSDGIVCLPSVAGESPAADRLQQLLAAAYGDRWSPSVITEELQRAGSKKKSIADWLRDDFFKQHCALFGNRPFVWHIWDGQRDGFSALVNYHGLNRKTLEKLTYTYLGTDWAERQKAEVRDEVAGAEARLAAAMDLQCRLELILEGEAPHDIYVRWKKPHEQPIGWEPDLNDGVRMNIRPFVEAGVLRSAPNIHWRKDRGKNQDGTERHNDIHITLADKHKARRSNGCL